MKNNLTNQNRNIICVSVICAYYAQFVKQCYVPVRGVLLKYTDAEILK